MSAVQRKRRIRTTRPSVKLADRVARSVIRIGGIGTIGAVSTVFLFLLWVIWPLVRTETVTRARTIASAIGANERVLAAGTDDTFSTIWTWTDSGRFVTLAASDGSMLEELRPFDRQPVSFSFPVRASQGIFGFGDGTVRLVRIENRTEYRDADAMPADVRGKQAGERFHFEGKTAERVGVDQFALRGIAYTVEEPIALAENAPIHAVDLTITSGGPAFTSIDGNGVLRVTQVSRTQNFMTGKEELSADSGELALESVKTRGLPRWVMLRGLAENALAIWEDGHLVRIDVRDLTSPRVAEEIDLLSGRDARIWSLAFLSGKNTLVVGDSEGGIRAWFKVPAPTMGTGDGAHLIRAHELERGPAPVTVLAASARTRLLAAGYADGTVRLYHVTSNRLLAELHTDKPVSTLAISPDDTSVLTGDGRFDVFTVDAPHPEVSARALFRPVLYEGYPEPAHVWQSSSGTDDFEPKLGLWPLVFGTIKATFYSMLIGVPIALLAAIATSEFLHPDIKTIVKPAIEMMASLPSVVLGFLAALILAPLVERSVPEVLVAVVLVPFALLVAAHSWQFLPGGRRGRLDSVRFVLAGIAILGGVAVAIAVGPVVERVLFAGDVHLWLDGKAGTATGGWLFVTLPLSAMSAALAIGRLAPQSRGRNLPALMSLAYFLAGTLATLATAAGTAWLLSSAGFDLRGPIVGTYVQRNALVVGFVMAFAIIPIIYTIAEDALSSIPETLRAGSLALGATPWQTAVRIVIPTAMSGLFSAIMIGLGRAVGETMIVLMAAGNTPVLDWNIFNGFRTLSANIAVELPEAVRNGTHYRTLFFAAATLFVMTFVLNTAAELVRMRFRGRAMRL